MKSPSENVTRILSWTLSGSILASSCSPIQEPQQIVQMSNKGKSAIPIALSEHERMYIEYLSGVASKMVKDPAFARAFSQAPEQYLVTRGASDGEMSPIDDELLKVTKALGDEEICQAIFSNDINEYLLLMYEKGYLNDRVKRYDGILTDEQKQQILSSLGMDKENAFVVPVAAVVAIFYAAVIAVSYVGVGYTVIAGVNVAAGLTVATRVAAWTSVAGSSSDDIVSKEDFEVWLLKAEDESIVIADENMRNAIDDAVAAFATIAEDNEQTFDVERWLKTINLNVFKDIEKKTKEEHL